ncbi:MAG: ligand-gated TonB-dependent outer rane channel [Verrucomicrobiales bacterium]|nr:ligand-gated TonB-dependent outer rane channel [Verrucomicrobiales bacterium]
MVSASLLPTVSMYRLSKICLVLSIALTSLFAHATETNGVPGYANDLTQLSLEDLMQVEVTTVSRSPEKLSHAPAAIAVVTEDDIRRSGATTIPEALRLVPGLQVARVDAHGWAVSARGFNDVFANKLLVMIDGRTIYTPLFSGVFWDVQDTVLEDIDRIEVIRGPGATQWGANAVNGVINIITKSAKETQGLLLSGGGGTEKRGFSSVRYGARFNADTYIRVYAKYVNRDDQAAPTGGSANDSWDMYRGGFRLDWKTTDVNLITFQGDIYSGRLNQVYTVPTTVPPFAALAPDKLRVSGGNLLARWTHDFSADAQLTLQAYYDRTVRNAVIFGEDRDTGDIDVQHRFKAGDRHTITLGGGYRLTHDVIRNSANISLMPSARTLNLLNAFVQDEIELQPEHWSLTIGTKLEHNDFTGVEVQPSARILWAPLERHAIWASVSRAVRTPSRAEDDVTLNPAGVPPGFATIHGNRNFDSEKLIAYELGYRVQPHKRITFDLAGFYNDYDDLRSFERTGTMFQSVAANNLFGETYGFEASSTLQALDRWRLTAGYTFLNTQLHKRHGSTDTMSEVAERMSPQNQISLRSSINLPGHVEFDQFLRYVDSIVVSSSGIPSYWSLDLRLGWKPNPHWEFSVVGQNLLAPSHPEFYPTFVSSQRTEVERGVYGKITVRF